MSKESKILKVINETITERLSNMQPSGTLLLSMGNEIIYKQCFGFSDSSKNIAISTDTQFLVGSVTKQFTAAAILKALFTKNIQRGMNLSDVISLKSLTRADLDKFIAFYLPEEHNIWEGSIPAWANTITLHQLLVHSSGIPNYTNLPDFENHKFLKTSDLVTFFKDSELEFIPGTKFTYSNSGYFLLGIIIEQITDQTLDAYMQSTFFESLEMHSTFLATKGRVDELISLDARCAHVARGYQFDITKQKPDLTEVNHYVSMLIPGAGGSLISTAVDLLKWNNALYSGKIIPDYLLQLMLYPHILTEQMKDYYGYGIEIMQAEHLGKYYTHRGGIPGFHSMLTFIPLLQLSIIILENIVEDKESMMPELEKIKLELPLTLSEFEKKEQLEKIIEATYPIITENRKHFLLAPIQGEIIKALEDCRSLW